jgi:hypothetical protein
MGISFLEKHPFISRYSLVGISLTSFLLTYKVENVTCCQLRPWASKTRSVFRSTRRGSWPAELESQSRALRVSPVPSILFSLLLVHFQRLHTRASSISDYWVWDMCGHVF